MNAWDSIQQVVRILMAYVGSYLVAKGYPSDMVTAATGGAIAILGLGWWAYWNFKSKAAPADTTTPAA